MVSKKTSNKRYWDSVVKKGIKAEYQSFLENEGLENTPDNAHLFALRVCGGSGEYQGYKKRDLILMLAGELPYMYD